MKKKLIDLDFDKWVFDNYYSGYIEMHELIDEYKSINLAQVETPSVSDNEQTQKVCQCEIKSYYKVGEIKYCAICKGVIIDKPSG